MQIVKQLKGEYSFCKNIYTTQRYDTNEQKKSKGFKPFRQKYYLKRSSSRKPYLSNEKHVCKFD